MQEMMRSARSRKTMRRLTSIRLAKCAVVFTACASVLKAHEPWSGHPELADLAGIERALTDSFDAEDAPVFTLADLQQVAPEDFEEARLSYSSSVRLIAVSTNAYPIWSALKAEEAPPAAARLEAPETVLVWREGGTSKLRSFPAKNIWH